MGDPLQRGWMDIFICLFKIYGLVSEVVERPSNIHQVLPVDESGGAVFGVFLQRNHAQAVCSFCLVSKLDN